MSESGGGAKPILVVGDVILDQMLLAGERQDTTMRHAQERGSANPVRSGRRAGGAALTACYLKGLGAKVEGDPCVTDAHGLNDCWTKKTAKHERGPARQTFGLALTPRMPDDHTPVLRVQRTLAFEYIDPSPSVIPDLEQQLRDNLKADAYAAIVLEDLNLYRYADAKNTPGEGEDQPASTKRQAVLKGVLQLPVPVLLKTTRPDFWLHSLAATNEGDRKDILVVANLNNMFLSQGLERSSWDRVVEQTSEEICKSVGGHRGHLCTALFLCDQEGLLLARADRGKVGIHLAWDRRNPLGGISRGSRGWVPGCQNVLVATLAQALANAPTECAADELWTHAQHAWRCARRAAYLGLIMDESKQDEWRNEVWNDESFDTTPLQRRVCDYHHAHWDDVPVSPPVNDSDKFSALIRALDGVGNDRETMLEAARGLAYRLVGHGPEALLNLRPSSDPGPWAELARGFPIYTIGGLVALEREEIGQLSRFTDLIQAYAARERPSRPLSLAVFGKPGAGKSFAVQQILQHLNIPSQPLDFNLSQFSKPSELTAAMHEIQTAGLQNNLPVVFWDEFDSAFGGEDNGWLKYFLAPMQDGEFANGAVRHALGRGVFVFAGGKNEDSKSFLAGEPTDEQIAAKVPDFASRLKGVYNIPPLVIEALGEKDKARFLKEHYPKVLRRALVIRRAFRKHAPQVVRVSSDALDKLLWGTTYETARSLENAIESATLGNQDSFGTSNLPDSLFPASGEGSPRDKRNDKNAPWRSTQESIDIID